MKLLKIKRIFWKKKLIKMKIKKIKRILNMVLKVKLK